MKYDEQQNKIVSNLLRIFHKADSNLKKKGNIINIFTINDVNIVNNQQNINVKSTIDVIVVKRFDTNFTISKRILIGIGEYQ